MTSSLSSLVPRRRLRFLPSLWTRSPPDKIGGVGSHVRVDTHTEPSQTKASSSLSAAPLQPSSLSAAPLQPPSLSAAPLQPPPPPAPKDVASSVRPDTVPPPPRPEEPAERLMDLEDPSLYGDDGQYLHDQMPGGMLEHIKLVEAMLDVAGYKRWPQWESADNLAALPEEPEPFLSYAPFRGRFVHWILQIIRDTDHPITVYMLQYLVRAYTYTLFTLTCEDQEQYVGLHDKCFQLLADIVYHPLLRKRVKIQIDGSFVRILLSIFQHLTHYPEKRAHPCAATGMSLHQSLMQVWLWCWRIGMMCSDEHAECIDSLFGCVSNRVSDVSGESQSASPTNQKLILASASASASATAIGGVHARSPLVCAMEPDTTVSAVLAIVRTTAALDERRPAVVHVLQKWIFDDRLKPVLSSFADEMANAPFDSTEKKWWSDMSQLIRAIPHVSASWCRKRCLSVVSRASLGSDSSLAVGRSRKRKQRTTDGEAAPPQLEYRFDHPSQKLSTSKNDDEDIKDTVLEDMHICARAERILNHAQGLTRDTYSDWIRAKHVRRLETQNNQLMSELMAARLALSKTTLIIVPTTAAPATAAPATAAPASAPATAAPTPAPTTAAPASAPITAPAPISMYVPPLIHTVATLAAAERHTIVAAPAPIAAAPANRTLADAPAPIAGAANHTLADAPAPNATAANHMVAAAPTLIAG